MSDIFFKKNKLIGVIHLPGLPGSPSALRKNKSTWELIDEIGLRAIKEAQSLTKAGFNALILENFGDAPFFKSNVPPETISSLTLIAAAIRSNVKVPVGINVLRNDAVSALSIASCTALDFIRVNIINGVSATDQGLVEGCAAELIRKREYLKSNVLIMADVHVKHAHSFLENTLTTALKDTYSRGGADALIISGLGTGEEIEETTLKEASDFIKKYKAPVYIGSGANEKNIVRYKKLGFGIIISSALRKGKKAGEPLDASQIKKVILNYKKKSK